jgi:hypothetical protein
MKFTSLLSLLGFALADTQMVDWQVAKMSGNTTFDNIKITGDPRIDTSIKLSGRVNRSNYCRGCIE